MSAVETPDWLPPAVLRTLQGWGEVAPGNPLGDLLIVQREAAGSNVRHAVKQVLTAGLKQLAETAEQEARVLRRRYVQERTVFDVANELHVAEVTVYKTQQRAIRRLAADLWEQELAARAAREQALLSRWPVATYDTLFGVEACAAQLRALLLTPGAPWLVALEGLGGLGKTSLAQQLSRELARAATPFVEFGWVTAQQRFFRHDAIVHTAQPALDSAGLIQALTHQLLGLPAAAPLAAPLAPERALAAVEERLKAQPHLVVIDNLETAADVDVLLPTLARLTNPSKFLLTSREAFDAPTAIYHFALPELREDAALALVRHEARLHGLLDVAAADDAALRPIYALTGGNPLALRLVTGQLHVLDLPQALAGLREAAGRPAEELYNYIYWSAWQRLPAAAQDALALLPLFADTGADFAALAGVSDQDHETLLAALQLLSKLSLVNVSGDLHARRYSIHRLTETFLIKEVIKWRALDGATP